MAPFECNPRQRWVRSLRVLLELARSFSLYLLASCVSSIFWTRLISSKKRGAPQPDLSLYYGSAGIILFFLKAFQVFGNPEDLSTAEAAGAVLLQRWRELRQTGGPGLYLGSSGAGFAFGELFRVTGRPVYSAAAQAVFQELRTSAVRIPPCATQQDTGCAWMGQERGVPWGAEWKTDFGNPWGGEEWNSTVRYARRQNVSFDCAGLGRISPAHVWNLSYARLI
jgi:hypothetical protein